MYKVIKAFIDLQDYKETKAGPIYQEYTVGDVYPRPGYDASPERIAELEGSDNRQGVPLIAPAQAEGAEASEEIGETPEEANTPATTKRGRKKASKAEED